MLLTVGGRHELSRVQLLLAIEVDILPQHSLIELSHISFVVLGSRPVYFVLTDHQHFSLGATSDHTGSRTR